MACNGSGRESDLKVRTGDASCNLLEQRLLDLGKLSRFNHVQDLFDFPQEHDFLLRTRLWPELEETQDHGFSERWVLLQELHDAVCQLRVVQTQTLGLVERDKDFDQELFVFLLKRQREAVDDAVRVLMRPCFGAGRWEDVGGRGTTVRGRWRRVSRGG